MNLNNIAPSYSNLFVNQSQANRVGAISYPSGLFYELNAQQMQQHHQMEQQQQQHHLIDESLKQSQHHMVDDPLKHHHHQNNHSQHHMVDDKHHYMLEDSLKQQQHHHHQSHHLIDDSLNKQHSPKVECPSPVCQTHSPGLVSAGHSPDQHHQLASPSHIVRLGNLSPVSNTKQFIDTMDRPTVVSISS